MCRLNIGLLRFIPAAALLCCLAGPLNAQLSGVKSIPGNYAGIEAAIADLNLNGVGPGGVTFNVAAGHAETFSSATAGRITTTTSSAAAPIVFQKSGGGANPLITSGAGSGTTDGIIVITGTDYITFDGIDVRDNPSNTNTTAQMEWGYALVKKSAAAVYDGCRQAVVRNCAVTLQKSNTATVGVKIGNHLATSTGALTITSPTEAHNNCRIYNDTIRGAYTGIRAEGYSASAPYTLYDQGNDIGFSGGNVIEDFGGSSSAAYGIYTAYQNELIIANNLISGGAGTTNSLYGVYTATASSATSNVSGNTITLTGSSGVYAVYNTSGSTASGNTVTISDNEITNCGASGVFYGIYSSATPASMVVGGNTISRCVCSSTLYGIYMSSSVTTTSAFTGNTLDSLITSGSSTAYGIYHNTTTTASCTTSGNTIRNLRSTGGSGTVYGIYTGTSLTHDVRKNIIAGVSSQSGTVRGIYVGAANLTTLANNFISGLSSPSGASGGVSPSVAGIWNAVTATAGTVNIVYNTVYLDAVSSSASFGSAAVFANSASTTEMRNNILVNASVPGGGSTSANTVVYLRSSTALGTYSSASNNNCFHAGAPSANRLIYFDGTNADQTLAQFKARVGPARDQQSVTENVPFVNTTLSPYDLHIASASATQCESGAERVTAPAAVIDDIDGNPRHGEVAYAGAGLAPDIGADEGNFTAADLTGPTIRYLPPGAGTAGASRSFPNVSINDVHGVDSSTGTRPRLYYKKGVLYNEWNGNTSATQGWKWVEANGTTSPFDFTIDYSLLPGQSVISGDTIFYFITAQDRWSTPNIGIAHGLFASSPASVALTAAAFPVTGTVNSYMIAGGMAGTYKVPGSFPSLTGAGGFFMGLNSRTLVGDVTVLITDSVYEDGTYGLNQIAVDPPNSVFGVRIAPDTNLVRTLFSRSGAGMLRIEGADGVTFDGRWNGSGRYLRMVNASTANSVVTFQSDALADTIRNCIIEGNNTTAAGGASCGLLRIGPGIASGNDGIVIKENEIRNRSDSASSPTVMFFALGSSGAYNSGNVIADNDFFNYTTHGVNVYNAGNGEGWSITDNHFYNNSGSPLTTGIFHIYFVPQAVSHSNLISGNYIGGTARYCTGAPMTNSGSSNCYGIAATVGPASPTSIQGNIIRNMTFTSTSGTGLFYGIYVNGGMADIGTVTGNVIGDPSRSNSIVTSQSGSLIGIHSLAPGAVNIRNNVVANVTATNSGAHIMGGILHGGGPVNMSNNTVMDLSSASASTTITNGAMFGIMSSSINSGQVIEGNRIARLSNSGGGSPGVISTYCQGIVVSGASSSGSISRNSISGLTNSSGGAGYVVGLHVNAGNWTVSNNTAALSNSPYSNGTVVRGIWDDGGAVYSNGYFHNTCLISGTNGTTAANSHGYARTAATAVRHANNIYFNARTGNGVHLACGSTVAGAWNSDFNFHVSPDTSAVAAYNNSVYGFELFKSNSAGDSYSLYLPAASISPSSLFRDAADGDLMIDSTNAVCWTVNGKGIAGPAADSTADDFHSSGVRSVTQGMAVDIGADEFTTSTTPPSAAVTGAPAANGATVFSFAGQNLAVISWGSGGTVPASVDFRYYSGDNPPAPLAGKYSNAYAAVTATGGSGYTYDITFGYSPAWLGTISSESSIRLAKRDGGIWSYLSASAANTSNKTVTMTGLTSFSDFALTDATNPLPVELTAFTAHLRGDAVHLAWKTASELNTLRFEVQRRTTGDWEYIGAVDAGGSSDLARDYAFIDGEPRKAAECRYRLRIVYRDGACEHSQEVLVMMRPGAEGFGLLANYPNPFNASSTISFTLPSDRHVKVRIMDEAGRETAVLHDGVLTAGVHSTVFFARDLPAGIYTCVVTAGTEVRTRRIVLAR